MRSRNVPRTVPSVLVEKDPTSVTVTCDMGEPVPWESPEDFGYGMYYCDPTGNGGKRFGVRFGEAITAWVFDNASATQIATEANYDSASVSAAADTIVVHFHDASLGLDAVGTIAAYSHVNGLDEQVDIQVTLLR